LLLASLERGPLDLSLGERLLAFLREDASSCMVLAGVVRFLYGVQTTSGAWLVATRMHTHRVDVGGPFNISDKRILPLVLRSLTMRARNPVGCEVGGRGNHISPVSSSQLPATLLCLRHTGQHHLPVPDEEDLAVLPVPRRRAHQGAPHQRLQALHV